MPSNVRPRSVRAHPSHETGRRPHGGAARFGAERLATRPGLVAPWSVVRTIGVDAPSVSTEVARNELVAAWPSVPYNENRMRLVLAIGRYESGYGMGWEGPGVGSHNMGAITAGPSWEGETFAYGDSRPEGSENVGYTTEFRVYPSRAAGWADLVRTALKTPAERSAADRGDVRGFAAALYAAGYYAGLASQSQSERIDAYAAALRRGLVRQSQSDPGAKRLLRTNHRTAWIGLAVVAGLGWWWTTRSKPQ